METSDLYLMKAALLLAAVLLGCWMVFGPLVKDRLEHYLSRRSKFASDRRPED